jgi:hypothetical protein
MLINANWGDLGYSRIGPRRAGDFEQTITAEQLAEAFARTVGYEKEKDSTGWWIRDPARVKGGKPADALEVAAVLDGGNYRDPAPYEFVRQLDASYYRNLCAPKIRFCNIDGEGRQGQAVR